MNQKVKLDTNSLKQLLLYLKPYRGTLILVTLCIVLSVVASTTSAMFLQTLIDNYIVPLIGIENPIYTDLINALIIIGIIYLLGTISTWIYNRQMVTIAQKTLKNIRDNMFSKMQNLSIRYFDTNTNGDIMSLYTNDIDTLRQMISQAIPQLISSIFSIIAIFFCMIYISVWLTIVVCITLFFILKIIKMVSKKSNIYFMEQQTTLADLDSYIEEMINGQKVIKIFCREDRAKENFQKYNQVWEKNSSKANGYGNSMTPIVNVLGYIQYIIIAILGAYISIKGITNIGLFGTNAMTLGMIASFLTLSRNFINPISQISNQFNSIIIALTGSSRIFNFMSEECETDDGYITLVNVIEENGKLKECEQNTSIWAWKNVNSDGTPTYTKLQGNIVFDHVNFSYTPEKSILHDITLQA